MPQVFSKFDLPYSKKNIPLNSKKEYLLQLVHSVEKFVRNLRWRAFFYLNPTDKQEKETYGFKSIKAAKPVKELKAMEERLKIMIRDVVFRQNVSNDFLDKLKTDINRIFNLDDLIVSADKTSNDYQMKTGDYNELHQRNIQKDYKKASWEEVDADLEKQKEIVTKLDIEDRVMYTPPQTSNITLKDHKPNFQNNPKCRLINKSKFEIGKISKQVLSRVVENVKKKTNFNLWKNTDSVITWFENLQNKQNLTFIAFDICDYYGSITEELFVEALTWAKRISNISDDEWEVIMEAKRSLLFDGKELWKKRGEKVFHIAMGSWDGAESTDIVGLFLLNKLVELKIELGLYRDDGLAALRCTARQGEKIKQKLIQIFSNYGLKLEVDANHKIVNFLDVTFDLENGIYKPFRKENNTIRYINTKSNHPPATIKNIPKNVNDRLSRNSANQEIFENAKGPYQDALDQSGYRYQLKFDPSIKQKQQQPQPRKNRKRKITWFNPPYSHNVKSNIGKIFLQIISDCFPPSHILHKICNRSTLKVSYRTMPNMKRHIARHNNKILREAFEQIDPGMRETEDVTASQLT